MKKNYIIGVLVLLAIIAVVPSLTQAAAKKWYIVESIENSGNSGLGGLKYQKTVDEDTKTVCYTAISSNKDVAISCVKR